MTESIRFLFKRAVARISDQLPRAYELGPQVAYLKQRGDSAPKAWFVLRCAGIAGPLVGFTSVLVAALLSPEFSWLTNAISELGASGATYPWLLNDGLVISGLLTLPFTAVVWHRARHPAERAGVITFALTMTSLTLIGVFPIETAIHAPVSVAFFVLGTLTLAIHGTGAVLAGSPRFGLVSMWLALVHIISWVCWYFGVRLGPGLAIPELLGAIIVFIWIGWTSLDGKAQQ